MSNETLEEDRELEELKRQIEQKAEEEKEKAALEPSPEPAPSPAPVPETQPSVIQESKPKQEPAKVEPAKAEDDPLKWAEKKGFKSPEDMARALLSKEQEFFRRNQAGHPGYKDVVVDPTAVPNRPPAWQPSPQMPTYQPAYYPPPVPNVPRQIADMYPQLNPEDIQKVMPLIVDTAKAINANLEREVMDLRRATSRNNEMMGLMQDPAFRDGRVQKEIHSILDSDPSIFQRERTPLVYAYEKAMVNLARKQLQEGAKEEPTPKGNTPPVTAGGGNGSAFTIHRPLTEREIESWKPEEIKAYIQSNGKVLPKRP